MKKIAIIGASGHGKVVADIAKRSGYERIIFLDDNQAVKKCSTYDVLGNSLDAEKFVVEGYDLIIAIGNAKIRESLQRNLSNRVRMTTLIHPNAILAEDVIVKEGTVIMAGAVINPGTTIGRGCIINTGATVDHDNCIDDFVHVSVGAHLAGSVSVGERTWIGAGAVVSNNVSICKECILGAGAVVVKNIEMPGTYVGVPARKVK